MNTSIRDQAVTEFSVIIPVYNEQSSIVPLFSSLRIVMDALAKPYEIIFVNDGSTDDTLKVLKSLASENLIGINLKHSGKSLALQAGFDRAKGKIIITMDGDGQNDPEDIPRLLEKITEGYDVVCGWRRLRHDPPIKKISSKIANGIRKMAFRENLHDVGCALRAYKAQSLMGLRLCRQRHRFLTAILKKRGARIGEVDVRHYPRRAGKSKYGTIKRLFGSMPDFFAILLER